MSGENFTITYDDISTFLQLKMRGNLWGNLLSEWRVHSLDNAGSGIIIIITEQSVISRYLIVTGETLFINFRIWSKWVSAAAACPQWALPPVQMWKWRRVSPGTLSTPGHLLGRHSKWEKSVENSTLVEGGFKMGRFSTLFVKCVKCV